VLSTKVTMGVGDDLRNSRATVPLFGTSASFKKPACYPVLLYVILSGKCLPPRYLPCWEVQEQMLKT
jgi:hypothetical protein